MPNIQHHIDLARWLTDDDAAIGVFGWCAFNDGRQLTRVLARNRDGEIASAVPFSRKDVSDFLSLPENTPTGFCLYLPELDQHVNIDVCAEDSTGNFEVFWSFRAGELAGKGPVILGYAALRRKGWGSVSLDSESQRMVTSLCAGPGPFFSILLPVYNTPPQFLRECVNSIIEQSCTSWELLVVDDGSTNPATLRELMQVAGMDRRIHVDTPTQRSGISRATNRAAERARGQFFAMVDHDDRLLPNALERIALEIARSNEMAAGMLQRSQFAHESCLCDAVYSDEEKIRESGEPCRPILKPAFSPELLRGVMYVGHLLCVRREVFREIGGFDPSYDGIQDYELLLRISERTRRIAHIPEILYQWRMIATSSALDGNVKGDIDRLQARAVAAHLERLGRDAVAQALGKHRVRILPSNRFVRPQIAIFVTSEAAASGPLQNVTGLELHLVDSVSAAKAAMAPARWHNSAQLVAFIGLRLIATSDRWLDNLAELALETESGRVAPIIRSVDGRVLESGRTVGPNGRPRAVMRGFDALGDGYNGSLVANREVALASPMIWMARPDGPPSSHRRFERTCAAAWVEVLDGDYMLAEKSFETAAVPPADPYLNPRFDHYRADYGLVRGIGNPRSTS